MQPHHPRRRSAHATAWLAAFGAVSGCAPEVDRPSAGALDLVSIAPEPGAQLALNGEVRITFDATLDPTTVTDDSVRLVDLDTGARARGEWRIDGRMLRFVPDGVTQRDLSDGAFRPGARLRVELGGFPRVSALRDVDGRVLRSPLVAEYAVVPASAESPFVDASPGYSAPLRLRRADPGAPEASALGHDEPLLIACDEPLDPRSLDPERFELVRIDDAGGGGPTDPGGAEPERVAVRALQLVQNAPPSSEGTSALLRVVPGRPFDVREWAGPFPYELQLAPGRTDPGLRDFSGGVPPWRPIRFLVARFGDAVAPESADSYSFEFDDPSDFAPLADSTVEGTAHWGRSGRVEVRFPRAAGDGRDGEVVLGGGTLADEDVHATRLTVPAGEEVVLAGEGLVVLRAQGRLDLDGRVVRRLPEGVDAPAMWNAVEVRTRRAAADAATLTDWLAEARSTGVPWTVFVAGGDVVIGGDVDLDTPLLIVAGGRVRGRVPPRTASGQLWVLGLGGFEGRGRGPRASNPAPPLVLDPPIVNPLRSPLTLVAYSSPVPKAATPRRWRRPEVVSRDGAHGAVDIGFVAAELPRVDLPGDEGARGAWLQDAGQAIRFPEPMGVVGGTTPSPGARVRLRIELRVLPAPAALWDPPFVDRVHLAWTEDTTR
ncbi:MAG: Ig-like domain-containing protein [Planctomycetota bacterium]